MGGINTSPSSTSGISSGNEREEHCPWNKPMRKSDGRSLAAPMTAPTLLFIEDK